MIRIVLGFVFLSLAGLVAAALLFTLWQKRRIEARFPPRGEFVEIAGARLHYTQMLPQGAPRGVVVLLHGASGNQADVMAPLGPPLAARGYRVIAFDRPGHGYSTRPRGMDQGAPDEQARLLRAGLAELGVTEAIVMGHSLAGALAANFAIEHRAFTRGLVLVAPVTHPWPGGVTWYYELAARPWIGRVFAYLAAMPVGLLLIDDAVRGVFAPQVPPPDYVERIGAPLVLRPEAFVANAQDVAGLAPFIAVQSKRMGEIEAPTTIVTGDRDGVVYAHLHSLGSARDIPHARLVTLPGVGHAVQNVAPDAVVAAVMDVAERSRERAPLATAP